MSVIYRNQICAVGSQAEAFLSEKNLFTFGGKAPDELRDFCYALPEATSSGTIGVGDVLAIGEHRFPITAIGALAQRNLLRTRPPRLRRRRRATARGGPPRTLWR